MTAQENQEHTVTTYTRVPHWLIFKGVRAEPLRLYVALGKYANNETGKAWPSIGTLMSDLRVSDRAIQKWTDELVSFGALKVEERRRPGHANLTNMYTLFLDDPDADKSLESGRRSERRGGTPVLPRGNVGSPELDSSELNPSLSLPDHEDLGASETADSVRKDQAHNLTKEAKDRLRDSLKDVGQSVKDGNHFRSELTQEKWALFLELLKAETAHLAYADTIMDLASSDWSVTDRHAEGWEAGKKLNMLLNTARRDG